MTNTITRDGLASIRTQNAEAQQKYLRDNGIKDEALIKEITADGKIDASDTRYLSGRVQALGDKADANEVSLLNGLKALDALDEPSKTDATKTDATKTDATKTDATKTRYPDAGALADVEAGKVTLKKGSGGAAVKETQDLLKQAGFEEKKYGADGKYGPLTEAKVREFQTANKLSPTGVVDKDTLAKLREVAKAKTDATKTDATKTDATKTDATKTDATKTDATKVETSKVPADVTADQLRRVETALTDGHGSGFLDVVGNASNAEIAALKEAYKTKHGKTLESAFQEALPRTMMDPDSRKLAEANMKGQREENQPVDPRIVEADARLLKMAMKGWGTDNGVLTEILSKRSPEHMRALKAEFEKIGEGQNLEQWIRSDTSGDFLHGLLANLNRR